MTLDDAVRLGAVQDPATPVEWFFQRAIEEPFGRHIRAIESEFVLAGYGLLRIYAEPSPAMDAGRARLIIERLPGSVGARSLRVVYLIYGVKGLSLGKDGLDPLIEDSERRNIIAVRLAIAHELGHLAMRHALVDNELSVPVDGFTREQDWAASAYAVYLLRHTGRYLHDRGKLFSPSHQAVGQWISDRWKEFASYPETENFLKYVTRRPRPWSDLDDDDVAELRDNLFPIVRKPARRRTS